MGAAASSSPQISEDDVTAEVARIFAENPLRARALVSAAANALTSAANKDIGEENENESAGSPEPEGLPPMIPHLSPSKEKNNRVGMSFDEGPGGSNGAPKPKDPHQERVKRAHSNEFFRPRVFSASEAAPKGGGIVRNMVHATFDRDVNDVYETTNATTLGTGLSGSVVRVVHRVTKVPYAMKTLRLEKTPTKKDLSEVLNDMKAEIEIMAELDHPNIVRLIDTFYTDTTVYLIMELVEGGELFDHLIYCSTKKVCK